jgi:hypothetical protein
MPKGPAPKGEYAGKSSVFSTRIRPDLRKNLEKAANQSGRSISQEVEYRLRRSFIEDERIAEAFGDRETYRLMRMLADAVHFAEVRLKQRWLDDPETFQTAITAMSQMLRAVAPEDSDSDPHIDKSIYDKMVRLNANLFAFDRWLKVRNADAAIPAQSASSEEAAKNSIAKRDLSRIVERTEWMFEDEQIPDALQRLSDSLDSELKQNEARLVKELESLGWVKNSRGWVKK